VKLVSDEVDSTGRCRDDGNEVRASWNRAVDVDVVIWDTGAPAGPVGVAAAGDETLRADEEELRGAGNMK
jgi:hypothetical protein